MATIHPRHHLEPMEKIVIGAGEVAAVTPPAPDQPPRLEPKLPPPVPLWAKLSFAPLVLLLPVLCIVTLIVRVAMRGLPPRTRFAWLSYLSTLLIISGMLTSIVTVLSVAFVPLPAIVNRGLEELDAKTTFPILPSSLPMSAKEISEQLKPLVPSSRRRAAPGSITMNCLPTVSAPEFCSKPLRKAI